MDEPIPGAAVHFAPVATARPDFVAVQSAFTEQELASIEACVARLATQHRLIGPEDDLPHDRLDAHVSCMTYEPGTTWVYEKIERLLHSANVLLRVALWGFAEPFEYVTFRDGRHCWHVDAAMPDDGVPRSPRKLSFELMLSGPGDYQGGERETLACRKHSARHQRGTLLVWPANVLTRVYHVTGARRSLMGWATGPELT